MVIHPISPIFDEKSEILILGSFPSVKSRENGFYYAHPKNRFWRVMAAVLRENLPQTQEEKTRLFHKHGIALWDVIGSCEIDGSADSSIRFVVPNDFSRICEVCRIKAVYVNGKAAMLYYNRYGREQIGLDAICLPSTSPANAAWSEERLVRAWGIIRGREGEIK